MAYAVGVGLALAVCLWATWIGLDRDRAFYPTLMMVIALYYGLFAVLSGSARTLILESVFIAAFFGVAVLGFKRNAWFVVGALFAHGGFDLVHARLISDPGVPPWWPHFCLTCDITMAAYLAWRLKRSRPVPGGTMRTTIGSLILITVAAGLARAQPPATPDFKAVRVHGNDERASVQALGGFVEYLYSAVTDVAASR